MTQKKKKMFIVFGTRPEAIKLMPLIKALEADGSFMLKLCVTAQHREMLDSVLKEFDIHPQFDLSLMREDQTLDYLTCEVLKNIGELLDLCLPDAVIIQGDTTTAFAAALAAFLGCTEQFAKKEGPKFRLAPIAKTDIVKTVCKEIRPALIGYDFS